MVTRDAVLRRSLRRHCSFETRCTACRREARLQRRARVAPAHAERVGDGASWVPLVVVGPPAVTLRFALARGTRGFFTTRRELNLAHRRMRAPWLLGADLASAAHAGSERRSRTPACRREARLRRRARVAPADREHFGDGASWVPLVAWGPLASPCRSRWRGVRAASLRRGGSSTLPTAACELRGSLVRI
jgi:hypothetical protein